MRAKDIIRFVEELKSTLKTNDPYKIAEYYGIRVLHSDSPLKEFHAYTMKFPSYPTIISINNAYTEFSKKLLCAHELGHALLHPEAINHFKSISNNLSISVEEEANLFALALLGDEDFNNKLTMPLAAMNNYLMKTIIDYNLKTEKEL